MSFIINDIVSEFKDCFKDYSKSILREYVTNEININRVRLIALIPIMSDIYILATNHEIKSYCHKDNITLDVKQRVTLKISENSKVMVHWSKIQEIVLLALSFLLYTKKFYVSASFAACVALISFLNKGNASNQAAKFHQSMDKTYPIRHYSEYSETDDEWKTQKPKKT